MNRKNRKESANLLQRYLSILNFENIVIYAFSPIFANLSISYQNKDFTQYFPRHKNEFSGAKLKQTSPHPRLLR